MRSSWRLDAVCLNAPSVEWRPKALRCRDGVDDTDTSAQASDDTDTPAKASGDTDTSAKSSGKTDTSEHASGRTNHLANTNLLADICSSSKTCSADSSASTPGSAADTSDSTAADASGSTEADSSGNTKADSSDSTSFDSSDSTYANTPDITAPFDENPTTKEEADQVDNGSAESLATTEPAATPSHDVLGADVSDICNALDRALDLAVALDDWDVLDVGDPPGGGDLDDSGDDGDTHGVSDFDDGGNDGDTPGGSDLDSGNDDAHDSRGSESAVGSVNEDDVVSARHSAVVTHVDRRHEDAAESLSTDAALDALSPPTRRVPGPVDDLWEYYVAAAKVVCPLNHDVPLQWTYWFGMAQHKPWNNPADYLHATIFQVLYGLMDTPIVPALYWSDPHAYLRVAQVVGRAEAMLNSDGTETPFGDDTGADMAATSRVLSRTGQVRAALADTTTSHSPMFVGHVPLDVRLDGRGVLVSPSNARDRMDEPDALFVPAGLRAAAVFAWPALSPYAILDVGAEEARASAHHNPPQWHAAMASPFISHNACLDSVMRIVHPWVFEDMRVCDQVTSSP